MYLATSVVFTQPLLSFNSNNIFGLCIYFYIFLSVSNKFTLDEVKTISYNQLQADYLSAIKTGRKATCQAYNK